jgi:hypothetical protein
MRWEYSVLKEVLKCHECGWSKTAAALPVVWVADLTLPMIGSDVEGSKSSN